MISNLSSLYADTVNLTTTPSTGWEMVATFWIEGILTPIVSVGGLIGNAICILVLSRNKRELGLKPSFTNLLIFLAVCDSFFLLFANLVYTGASHLSPAQYLPLLKSIPILLPLIHISLTGSVYTTVAVAVERYTTFVEALSKPANMCQGWFFIIIIIFFSLSYNIVRFFELRVEEVEGVFSRIPYAEDFVNQDEKVLHYSINATWLRRNPTYSVYYIMFGNFLIMSLIPVILLTVLNYLIFRGIRRATMLHNSISAHHRRDTTMATLLSSIVVVFLCCHSTKLVTNTYEAYQMVYYGELMVWPPWAEVLSRWNHFMLAVNASINIFIYVVKDFKFRAALSSMFCTSWPGMVKDIFCANRRNSTRSSQSEMTMKTCVKSFSKDTRKLLIKETQTMNFEVERNL